MRRETRNMTGRSLLVYCLGAVAAWADPLRVCTTTPDLADLVREVGGAEVQVISFAKGVEDPHFVEAKPSYIKELSRADVYVQIGMELEVGWAPPLLDGARNEKLRRDAPGFIDASAAIAALEIPAAVLDRSMGDVHPEGNPHYLLDPVNGLKVAELIRDRLSALRPEAANAFQARWETFRDRTEQSLAAWTARLKPFAGTRFVADHNMWPYFAARFGLVEAGRLEPKPGVPPTTRHLKVVVEKIKAGSIGLIIASSYYDPRHADFVARNTRARVLQLAHQVGARPGTDTYLEMIDYNVNELAQALEAAPR